ncbi:MAG: hypothetical protein ACI9UV_002546, partial [Algoriphagus sp.]
KYTKFKAIGICSIEKPVKIQYLKTVFLYM